jgi:spermidine synthase
VKSKSLPAPRSRRFLPVLALLLAGSGCSALIYEIVWLQLLQLTIGASAVSMGVLLGAFMGGICLGSIGLPRIVSAKWHPLRVYAILDLGIGILGIGVWVGLPYAGRFYAMNAGQGLPGFLFRGLVSAAFLLPPTLLMGASLPAAARWVDATPKGVSWLGFFYGANLAGAVFGCVLAGFYLLRVYDMATATLAAAAINGAVALTAAVLAAIAPYRPPVPGPTQARTEPAQGSWPVYAAIALSGASALGAEVVWTRLLSLIMGGTVYTFSIILAVFLLALGIGGGAGSFLARRVQRPQIALGCCQILLAGAIAFAAYMFAESLPYWRLDPADFADPWAKFRFDLVRCLCAVPPAACLWGASFPIALAAGARPAGAEGAGARRQDPGRLVGRVYAANTIGAIVGAIGFSIVLIPGIGTQNSQRLLIGLSTVAALLGLAPVLRPSRAVVLRKGEPRKPAAGALARISLLVSVGMAALLAWQLPALPWEVVAWGHHQLPPEVFRADLLYMGEGMNASIAVTQKNQIRSFHVNGKVEASGEPQDMRLQRMLGHIPALLHPHPRSVLIVGCGAGVTAGAFVVHPSVARIVICEIEPLVPPAAAEFFHRENHDVVRDPRTRIVLDDARHYVLTTHEKFDIITSDPIHPWVKGSATLYTREYFELCKRHLNPGGLITQWVPLYQSTMETVKSEIATFFQVFPNGTIWCAEEGLRENDDVVLLGQTGPAAIDIEGLQQRLDRADHSQVAASLRQVRFRSALDLLGTYAGRGPDLQPWLAGAEINTDRNLRLQYLAGMGLNLQDAESIYGEMLHYRAFPEDLFTGSDERKNALREALDQR